MLRYLLLTSALALTSLAGVSASATPADTPTPLPQSAARASTPKPVPQSAARASTPTPMPQSAARASTPTLMPQVSVAPCVCPYVIFDQGESGDGVFGAQLTYTTLSVGTPGRFIVKIYGGELTTERLNAVELFFDVNKSNTGPEYRFSDWLTRDRDGRTDRWVAKIDVWHDYGNRVPCPRWQTDVNYASDVITMSIPRACIGSPSKVRWNPIIWHFTQYEPEVRGYSDGAPHRHQFAAFWTGKGEVPCTC